MIKEVEKFLLDYQIRDEKIIVGFSAGPDSCALAYILSKLASKYNLELVLAYFNHNWRKKEAKEEENYSFEFAKKINAQFYSEVAPENCSKTEETARNLRYKFFENCMNKFKTKYVFLAHNLDDNIETLIYRVIKGTSIKGLCSILPNRDNYYRPLMNVQKSEILNFLKENNIEYKYDSSNDDVKYKRNLIRKEILPLFKKINPNCAKNIQNLILNAIDTSLIVSKVIKEIESKIIIDNKILYDEFVKLDREYRLEIINNFLGQYLKYRDSININRFDEFILKNNNSKISVNKELFLIVKNNYIFLDKIKDTSIFELSINTVGKYRYLNGTLSIEKVKNSNIQFPSAIESCAYLNIDFPVVLRHRRNGDIFSPLGLKNGKMKLKDYFINEKFTQNEKNEFLLLCKDNEVCWIIENRISEKYKITNKSNCYKITWSKNG